MAKLRTHKGISKRVRITKKQKIIVGAFGWNHLKAKKNPRIKYRKKQGKVLKDVNAKPIKKLLPGVSSL